MFYQQLSDLDVLNDWMSKVDALNILVLTNNHQTRLCWWPSFFHIHLMQLFNSLFINLSARCFYHAENVLAPSAGKWHFVNFIIFLFLFASCNVSQFIKHSCELCRQYLDTVMRTAIQSGPFLLSYMGFLGPCCHGSWDWRRWALIVVSPLAKGILFMRLHSWKWVKEGMWNYSRSGLMILVWTL